MLYDIILRGTHRDISDVRNKRLDTKRGGSFKTEEGTGIVNIVACTFKHNFSFMGGAVYVRNNFTNIVDSVFINNTSTVSERWRIRYFYQLFMQKLHSQPADAINCVAIVRVR